MPKTGIVDTPFDDYIAPLHSENDSMNRSAEKEPGYKSKDESPNAPSVTHRHSNLDGGKSPDGTASQSPDFVKTRVG